MSDTSRRIIVAAAMIAVAVVVGLLQCAGYPAVRWLGIAIVALMMVEMALGIWRSRNKLRTNKNWLVFGVFFAWLCVMMAAINSVGTRPVIVLLLLLIISAADSGAWMFGKLLGGDKMWERLSSGKTWSGQIAGIICGALVGIIGYRLMGVTQWLWLGMCVGISMALLSQYGDLTASMIKRRMGIKDFGSILPGHGGILDRFDGWIYVLPLVWLVAL